MNAEYFRQTGESRVPGGCEFYSCNEGEGLDDEGRPHCFNYVDAGDMTEERVDDLSVPRQDGGDDVH